jgi:hypothetical protein
MQDKDFLNRVKIGIDSYISKEVEDYQDAIILEEFLKWLYKEYGIAYHGNP